ncbi:YciI family protein [Nocardia sp. CDC153]|uniref:YciI family protein n=1 Tax=Nocardia sp. CDC153 TaxID=3112167 RepID=UPI002DBD86A3|nr:YciI family protein [Nocardia sp. CDC153]MEC3951726.1 YciI family protein [Nocardia sp. CDC153]
MKYVLFYDSAPDVADRAPAYFAEHCARWREFADRGELLMIGTFADPQTDGSMAVFTTEESARQFAESDPFVVNGVVSSWRIKPWNEALA